MAGEVSHDFNNTLAVVSSAVDVLEQKMAGDVAQELFAIKESTRISATLTNKLLTFCRGYGQSSQKSSFQI